MSETADTLCRWAILGTGGVARKFVLDLKASGAGRAVVVASRNPDNAHRFAAELGVATAAPDYETAVQAAVDAVYVATPPALHEAHALLAIGAGHAVLIEKPFAANAAAAARITAAAHAAGVFCMEAMWTRFQPMMETLRAKIASGDLGEIRGFDARFMVANRPDAASSLFAGGALIHRGIYPLSLARHLLGPVTDMQAMGRLGETGADEDCVLVLRHASGALSTLRASLRADGPEGMAVHGTQGTAVLDGPVYRPTRGHIRWTRPLPAATGQAGPRRFEAFRESTFGLRLSRGLGQLKSATGRAATRLPARLSGNGYRYQALAVAEALRAGRTEDPRMTPEESLEIMDLIDRARASWQPEN